MPTPDPHPARGGHVGAGKSKERGWLSPAPSHMGTSPIKGAEGAWRSVGPAATLGDSPISLRPPSRACCSQERWSSNKPTACGPSAPGPAALGTTDTGVIRDTAESPGTGAAPPAASAPVLRRKTHLGWGNFPVPIPNSLSATPSCSPQVPAGRGWLCSVPGPPLSASNTVPRDPLPPSPLPRCASALSSPTAKHSLGKG